MEIKSSLTNKSFPSQKLREFEVPDESGNESRSFESQNELGIDQINALMKERNMPPLDASVVSAFNARQAASRGHQAPQQEDFAAFEKKVSEARKAKITGKDKLSSSAKQRIEMLCQMSRASRSVDIDGNIFVLQTLKGKEQRSAILDASAFDGSLESPFEVRRQLLARSIVEIAGTEVELFLGDSSFEAKLEFIEELDEAVLIRLFNEYQILVREVRDKYTIKSDADAKEVVDSLKK
jgi:hypothetical protein